MAFDAFLKIEGVDGEVTTKGHEGSVEVLSWSWGVIDRLPVSEPPGGGARVLDDFQFVHSVDKTTPKLLEICCTGQHIKKAVLTVRRSSGKQNLDFLRITLTNFLISSLSNREGSAQPREEVGFNFQTIEYDYRAQKPDGTLGAAVHGECHHAAGD